MKVYYKNAEGKYITYDGLIITEEDKIPKNSAPILGGSKCEATQEGLKQFYKQFDNEAQQLITNKFKFDVRKCNSIDHFISKLFEHFRGDKDIEHDQIEYYEFEMFQKTFKNCFVYSKEGYFENVSAYDEKNFYMKIMGNNRTKRKIPYKKGILKFLEELPTKLEYGIYHVQILSSHPQVQKIFAFSKDNHYTHEDIIMAQQLKKHNIIDSITLVHDGQPNALIYTEDKLILMHKIFYKYYRFAKYAKEVNPKSSLAKQLNSSLHGRLSYRGAVLKLTDKQIRNSKNLIFHYTSINKNGEIVYHVTKKQSKSKIRIQPFLYMYARKKLYTLLTRTPDFLNNIIRIWIDGFILKKPLLKYPKELKIETKYHNKNITINKDNSITIS